MPFTMYLDGCSYFQKFFCIFFTFKLRRVLILRC